MEERTARPWDAVLSVDPEHRHQARLVKSTLLLVAAIEIPLAIATPLLSPRPLPIVGIHLAIIAVTLGGLALVRSGSPRAAGILFTCLAWAALTASIVLLGGTRSPSFFTYFAIVFMAGFLWSVRAAAWLGALSAASGIAIAVLEDRGLLPESLAPATSRRLVEALIAQIVVTAALLRFASSSVRSSFAEARRNELAATVAARTAERRARQLETIARLGELALATGELQALFDQVVRTVADTLGVEFCKVMELSPDGSMLLVRAGVGWRDGVVGAAQVPTGRESQAGFTLVNGGCVVVDDFEVETRFHAPALLRDHGVESGISALIASDSRAFGVLGAHSRTPRHFEAQDAQFIQSVANLLSAAVSRSRLERRMAGSQKLEALGRLAGGIAHDFNNLLTVVLGYADLLVDGLDADPKLREDAAEIRNAAERAKSLTSELLAFAKRQPTQTEVVDLAALVRRGTGMLGRLVGEAVQIEVAADPDLWPIEADPAQIERVLANLVINARDAMTAGGRVTIELTNRHTESGPRVEFAIRDTGCGMAPAVQDRIFEPFFTTKAEGHGTGLGLTSVYGIVQQLGGDIRVTSSPGFGTEIVIELQRATEHAESAPSAHDAAVSLDGRGTTVLLAEDDEALRRLIRGVLAARGFRVLEASDGRSAIDLASRAEERVDLILTDVVMPDTDGIELAAAVHSIQPDAPVIFMSGYDRSGQLSGSFGNPQNLFLAKPFRSRDLLIVIELALSRDGSHRLGVA